MYKIDLNVFKRGMTYCQALLCVTIKEKSYKIKTNTKKSVVKPDGWVSSCVIFKFSKSISKCILNVLLPRNLDHVSLEDPTKLVEVPDTCGEPLIYHTVLDIGNTQEYNPSPLPWMWRQTQKQFHYSGVAGLGFISSVAPQNLHG